MEKIDIILINCIYVVLINKYIYICTTQRALPNKGHYPLSRVHLVALPLFRSHSLTNWSQSFVGHLHGKSSALNIRNQELGNQDLKAILTWGVGTDGRNHILFVPYSLNHQIKRGKYLTYLYHTVKSWPRLWFKSSSSN